jgi:hypothetical protein
VIASPMPERFLYVSKAPPSRLVHSPSELLLPSDLAAKDHLP